MRVNAKLVKKLREQKQWTQEQLSQACGLSLRTIQRLENSGNASVETIRSLAAVFEVDYNELSIDDGVAPATPLDAIKTCLKKYADFSGTAGRQEFWWFFVFFLLIASIATVWNEKAIQIFSLLFLLPLLAAGTRRLKDAGQSAWWQLLYLVPFGIFVVGYLLSMDSKQTAEANSLDSPIESQN